MKQLFVYFLFIIFVASACRSSARFSTTNSTVHENSSNDLITSKESSALNSFIKQWLYTPYKYGGMNKSGIDCSGFSTVVMREVYNITVPRTAGDQYNGGEKVREIIALPIQAPVKALSSQIWTKIIIENVMLVPVDIGSYF
jgi:hypothetical protein